MSPPGTQSRVAWAYLAPSSFTGPSSVLYRFGLALFLLMVPTAIALLLDPRTIDDALVWWKPLKFLASIGVFSMTSALALREVKAEAQRSALVVGLVATLIVTSVFELAYIGWQAAQGEASHFNTADRFHAAMYSLMGVGAVALTCTSGGLAWLIARHARAGLSAEQRLAWVLGLCLTVALGIFTGGFMSAQPGHFVGHPAGGSTVPVLGWSLVAGDYRVAHFLGMHAQQAIPLAGLVATRLPMAQTAVRTFAGLWCVLTAISFLQAVQGVPFWQWPL